MIEQFKRMNELADLICENMIEGDSNEQSNIIYIIHDEVSSNIIGARYKEEDAKILRDEAIRDNEMGGGYGRIKYSKINIK